jgi:hypothetical protein
MSEISAYHEAGHAFMAIFVGARIPSLCVNISETLASSVITVEGGEVRISWIIRHYPVWAV